MTTCPSRRTFISSFWTLQIGSKVASRCEWVGEKEKAEKVEKMRKPGEINKRVWLRPEYSDQECFFQNRYDLSCHMARIK